MQSRSVGRAEQQRHMALNLMINVDPSTEIFRVEQSSKDGTTKPASLNDSQPDGEQFATDPHERRRSHHGQGACEKRVEGAYPSARRERSELDVILPPI